MSNLAKTCPGCGIDIAGNTMQCPDCGGIVLKNQHFCPNCHRAMQGVLSQEEPPAPTAETPAAESQAATETDSKRADGKAAATPRQRRLSWIAFLAAFVIALTVVLLMIYFYQDSQKKAELRAYENAMLSNEPSVMQEYLDIFTMAQPAHRDSVQNRLAVIHRLELEWTNAAASRSRSSLQQFIDRHPDNVHIPEARIMIDSIDWNIALKEDTPQAFKTYMETHEDGAYYDEAQSKYDLLDAKLLKDDERQLVNSLMQDFLTALAANDATSLTATLAADFGRFQHQEGATAAHVVNYMARLHEPDITKMTFAIKDDKKIEKIEGADRAFSYDVTFTAEQHIERTDESKERVASYLVAAKVSSDGRISGIDMRKINKQ